MSIRFQVFRVHAHLPSQFTLERGPDSSAQALNKALQERPSFDLREGHTWHVGNLSSLDENGIYFALGRISKARVEQYDPDSGNFIETEFEAAPYTHVLVDTRLGLCGIAAKSALAPTTSGIARQLGRLLNTSSVAREHNVDFEVVEIKDPDTFLEHLRSAYSVTAYSVWFLRPNPWDVNREFQEPMEKLLNETNGLSGRTDVRGENLNTEVLEDLTRSAAASGSDASARIRAREDEPPITHKLSASTVTLTAEEFEETEEKRSALGRIRDLYDRIRNRGNSR